MIRYNITNNHFSGLTIQSLERAVHALLLYPALGTILDPGIILYTN